MTEQTHINKEAITMKKICKKCKTSYERSVKRCPICNKRLSPLYSEAEKKQLEEEDLAITTTVITSLLM